MQIASVHQADALLQERVSVQASPKPSFASILQGATLGAQAGAQEPRFVSSLAEIQDLLKELVTASFPELKQASIKLAPLQDEAVFFQSNFEPLSLFTPDPQYIIQVNPALFQRRLPREAAQAILAHELSHTLDFQAGGTPGVIGVGWQLLTQPAVYERRTDLQAILRGYGSGLIAYRKWVYAQIPAQHLPAKQASYYQPHEIHSLMKQLEQARSQGLEADLAQSWLSHPPRHPAEIEAPPRP